MRIQEANISVLSAVAQVRMQAEGKLPEGTPKRYPSAVKAYGIIVRCRGSSCTYPLPGSISYQ